MNEDIQNQSPEKIIKIKNDKQNSVKKSSSVPSKTPIFENEANLNVTADTYYYKKDGIKIPKWTKFQVKSNNGISNWQSAGTTVSFTTVVPVFKTYITIPTGTIFKGNIKKVHKSQITGNGGLVEIDITSMLYKGKTYPVKGKIIKVNSDHVFFNKIKGARQYIKGVKQKINSATNFYNKARQISNKLAKNPIGVILSPLPTITGFVGGTAGTLTSPITALTQKGGNVSLPTGTTFEIRLLEAVYVE